MPGAGFDTVYRTQAERPCGGKATVQVGSAMERAAGRKRQHSAPDESACLVDAIPTARYCEGTTHRGRVARATILFIGQTDTRVTQTLTITTARKRKG